MGNYTTILLWKAEPKAPGVKYLSWKQLRWMDGSMKTMWILHNGSRLSYQPLIHQTIYRSSHLRNFFPCNCNLKYCASKTVKVLSRGWTLTKSDILLTMFASDWYSKAPHLNHTESTTCDTLAPVCCILAVQHFAEGRPSMQMHCFWHI